MATVGHTGLVSGVPPGECVITAVYGGQTTAVPVQVSATSEGISAFPNPVSMSQGGNPPLTVTAEFSDGTTRDVTSVANWWCWLSAPTIR